MKNTHTLLIVDDLKENLTLLSKTLSPKFKVQCAKNAFEAIEHIQKTKFDAIILDMIMPVIDGLELYDLILKESNFNQCPILFRSGNNDPELPVGALKKNRGEFLSPDMGPEEMALRISNQIEKLTPATEKLKLNNLILDLNAMDAFFEPTGQQLQLTKIEFKILKTLAVAMKNNTTYVSREKIIENAWGHIITENTLNTHLSNLRSKLKNYSVEIKSLRSRGLTLRLC